jgi:hypothetical protein
MFDLLMSCKRCASWRRTSGTHQLSHGLFRFFLRLHVDAKGGQVQDKLSVDALFIARVAIYVWPPVSRPTRHQGLLVLTGVAFGGDSPQFNAHGMLTLLKVRKRVAVPTHACILLAATAQRTTGKAEPKILFEVTFQAVCQSCAPPIIKYKRWG